MDHQLLENLLIELLQLPNHLRTPEKVMANLTLAATAAGLSLSKSAAPLQVEHLQLAAAIEHLAADLGSAYRARAMLRLGGGLEGVELGAVLEPVDSTTPLPRFIAFGTSARAVLAGINRDIRAHTAKPTKAPAPRKAGRLQLARLANALGDAA